MLVVSRDAVGSRWSRARDVGGIVESEAYPFVKWHHKHHCTAM